MADDEQAERDEQHYMRGRNAAWRSMLAECLRNLDDGDRDAHSWKLERAAIIAVLRDLCERFGDNGWPNNLDLGDVLRKYLEPYLEAEED